MKKKLTFITILLSFSVVNAEGCDALLTRDAAEFIGDIVTIARIAVPILLVVLCSADFIAIVTGQDEKVTKSSISRIIKRFIAAAAFFFVPLIIQLILGIDAVNNALNLVDDPSCGIGGDLDGYKTEEEIQKETEERLEEERKKKEEEEKKKKEEEKKKQEEEKKKQEEEKKKQEEEEKKKQEEEEKKKQEEDKKKEEGNNDGGNKDDGDDKNNTPPPSGGLDDEKYPPKKVTANITKNYYKSFTYYLYLPDKVTKNLPIILYMHGLSERGNDYFNNSKTGIKWGPLNEVYKHNYSYNAIIVVPQVPSEKSVNQYIGQYIALLNDIAKKYGANKNKISAMGFSHGCYGMVNLINDYPKYFSAAVFVGCAPNKSNKISKYTYQPVWTFVGGGDGTRDYNDQHGSHYSLENFTKEINKLGGNAKHTNAKNKVHNILNNDYSILRDSELNVIGWMIRQSR